MRIHSTSDDERAWLYTSSQRRQRHCSCSLSREYLLRRVLYRGGPSSTTPVLLSCVDSFDTAPPPCYPACLAPLCLLSCVGSFDTAPPPQDLLVGILYTAPPPQDLLAGILYTAPPPSTGDGSLDSYLESP